MCICIITHQFLGHIIGQGKIHMDMEKVKVIQEWKTPINNEELRSFRRSANYYCRLVFSVER